MSDVLRNSWREALWSVEELTAAKQGRTVSVVLPALNEEATVAAVVRSILPLLGGLVDDLLVLDSGSVDATAAEARRAGARVVTREQAVPHLQPRPGKGEVLWRSLAATDGDLVVFVDSDLLDPNPRFVPSLLGPLLLDTGVQLVKGFYRRPLRGDGMTSPNGGGRVTEMVARPLLAALLPDLAGVLQPLGGEYGGTRELLSSIPFAPGYGVEIGILIDTYRRLGVDSIGQVGLGVREHRNRPTSELAVMSRQIMATMFGRLGIADSAVGLTTFGFESDPFRGVTSDVLGLDRPPMAEVSATASEEIRAS
ncbi:glucosyl-3-phosphoglycerate synthase [Rhodococcus sp. 06-156-3C]|uniref:glucosyl-3-phosphoglycerate synthase n=1 Tax=Nocardiaceae TaxID=85025 RepID=UPI0005230531|nr:MULTISPECIES: glucosyl-3-phosphoglycerate synthase [Rhodococcus]OZD11891.1 glucosyl-3-phosphoglycerate synthase [Rhodococcus sp. 06-156-4C]OZD23556.1 glucosyl-3-phosphoglycerate synthase [Rhodococcus sp. 06-156-4a]OZD27019.1 glucosyl-3-phosphoglycerate synthase [Rhodococcus sp. 06-156-3C]OZD29560.1 glucosyl-3-phosphoglycerate synthase [Rhodococcus sp. 06-156-3b]OZD31583.1 glucosyl-3-phosphoglycerate synthase [Rhodococcus sp. 06-156-3]